MKIARLFAHRVELPLHETTYKWSGGKSVTVFDSTIVGVETDTGLIGYGEVCPLGPFYLPAYAEGVRAGLRELGPHLLGEDPRQLVKLNRTMDAALKGHPYVKSGIDIACWDILGQASGLPVATAYFCNVCSGDCPIAITTSTAESISGAMCSGCTVMRSVSPRPRGMTAAAGPPEPLSIWCASSSTSQCGRPVRIRSA